MRSGRSKLPEDRQRASRSLARPTSMLRFERAANGDEAAMAGTEIESEPVRTTARRVAVATLVVLAIVVLAFALWKLRVVVALLLCAITIAAAMRPGVEWLARRRVPRVLGVLLHYVVLLGFVALVLWLVVPRLTNEVQAAIDAVHPNRHGGGVKGQALDGI